MFKWIPQREDSRQEGSSELKPSVKSQSAVASVSSSVGAGQAAGDQRHVWHGLPGTDHGVELGSDDQTTRENRHTPAGTFFRGNYGNYLDTGTYM